MTSSEGLGSQMDTEAGSWPQGLPLDGALHQNLACDCLMPRHRSSLFVVLASQDDDLLSTSGALVLGQPDGGHAEILLGPGLSEKIFG